MRDTQETKAGGSYRCVGSWPWSRASGTLLGLQRACDRPCDRPWALQQSHLSVAHVPEVTVGERSRSPGRLSLRQTRFNVHLVDKGMETHGSAISYIWSDLPVLHASSQLHSYIINKVPFLVLSYPELKSNVFIRKIF